MLHDLPDNTKVVPRVYDLVKKYENVIVICHDPAITSSSIVNGVDKFKELNRFDLVKSGFCNRIVTGKQIGRASCRERVYVLV